MGKIKESAEMEEATRKHKASITIGVRLRKENTETVLTNFFQNVLSGTKKMPPNQIDSFFHWELWKNLRMDCV